MNSSQLIPVSKNIPGLVHPSDSRAPFQTTVRMVLTRVRHRSHKANAVTTSYIAADVTVM